MDKRRFTGELDTIRVIAVGASAMMGAGVLYGPGRISLVVGILAPVAYVLAGVGTIALAMGFVVVASGPLGNAFGGAYLHLSRIWKSRFVGLVLSAPVPVAYVALLAALARWLAGAAPLPTAAGGIVARVGTSGAPGRQLFAFDGPLSVLNPHVTELMAIGILSVALGIHLAGATRAANTGLILTGSVIVVGLGCLLSGFFPGVDGVVVNNFAPVEETHSLRASLGRLPEAVVVALFSFVGFEASATAVDVPSNPDSHVPRGIILSILGLTALFALAGAVTLGVLGPTRLRFAAVPVGDALAVYLPVTDMAVTQIVPVVLGLGAVLGLGWPASRTLAGMGEIVNGPVSCSPERKPVVSLTIIYISAAGIILVDGIVTIVSAALGGLVMVYLAHAMTTAVFPFLRPDVYERSRFAPPPWVLVSFSVVAILAAIALLRLILVRSPATTLSYTNHGPVVVALGLAPFAQPLGRVVPPLIGIELLAVTSFLVARDLREGSGTQLPPVDSCYPLTVSPAGTVDETGTGKHDATQRTNEHGADQSDGDGDNTD